MKMISAGTAAANEYRSFIHNCLRQASCEPAYTAPLPAVSSLQLYADFGNVQPTDVEFTFIDTCNNTEEQITPSDYTIGQTPKGTWYGVFRNFNNPAALYTAFVVHLSADDGAQTFFSEMLSTELCGPLMKIKSCHPEGATTTGFDINGIYYGLPQGAFLGSGIRYWHIAWVRMGKVRELSNKGTFKSNLYSNFRTTVEKIHLLQTEFVPKWYKDVLLAIYSRGVVSVNDGPAFIVSDLAIEPLNDDDLIWKPYAQLKETFRLYYGCDDAQCESCCNPLLISVTMEEGPIDSEPGESEPTPPTGCLRVIFGISGSDGQPWAIGGLMCDGHPLSMEAVVGDGIAPLPLCVQFDSLTGINPPVSILFTEPCPNDCVIYRNPSLTENTTGITYRDCAGVWHEDITLGPGEEICARRSWVIGPTTGAAGPGSGTLEEIGFCGSFPDESESGGSGSGSESEPGGGSEPGSECCDPVVLTAGTETTVPDGSLPGGESESVAPTCCTPVVLNACIETIPDESESVSESESESEGPQALRLLFDDIANADALVGDASDVADWNTFFNTGALATTPFSSVTIIGDEVLLFGCTELSIENELFRDNLNLLRVLDDAETIIETLPAFAFRGCTNLTEVSMPACIELENGAFFLCTNLSIIDFPALTTLGSAAFSTCTSLTTVSLPSCTTMDGTCFLGCTGLTSVSLPLVATAADSVFSGCNALTTLNLPSLISCGFQFMAGCTGLTTIGLPVCSDLGSSVFQDDVFDTITGNTITLTILTATATDGDVTALEGSNTVTLILV